MSTTSSSPAPTRLVNLHSGRLAAVVTAVVVFIGASLALTQADRPGDRPVPAVPAAPASHADAWILHHHGLNTAAPSRSAGEIAAERFHHR
jgi:hypothetical protein